MGVFVYDTMTDSDGTLLQSHTGEVGATWARYPGYTADATITGNRVRGDGANFPTYYASGSPGRADYDVQATLRVVTSAVTGDLSYIIGRADVGVSAGQDTFYYMDYYEVAGQWSISKAVAGAYSSLGTFAQSLGADTSYAMKLEMRGTALKAYVDGTERISTTDSAISAAGRAGLSVTISTTTGYHLDDFLANDFLSLAPKRRGMAPALLAM